METIASQPANDTWPGRPAKLDSTHHASGTRILHPNIASAVRIVLIRKRPVITSYPTLPLVTQTCTPLSTRS